MTVKEAVIEKLEVMPTEQQLEVLEFINSMRSKLKTKTPRKNLQGSLAHLNIKFTEADLREASNEMWRGYTKDTENEK